MIVHVGIKLDDVMSISQVRIAFQDYGFKMPKVHVMMHKSEWLVIK